MDNENELDNSQNVQETSMEESTSEVDTQATGEENTENNEQETIEDLNKKLYARVKKAEAEAKALREQVKAPKTEASVPLDDLFIIKDLGLSKDEYKQVSKFASDTKTSLEEASKNPIIKSYLEKTREEKATAQAASVGGTKRGPAKITDESILEDFHKGKMPEDEEGWRRLAQAEINLKKKALKKG